MWMKLVYLLPPILREPNLSFWIVISFFLDLNPLPFVFIHFIVTLHNKWVSPSLSRFTDDYHSISLSNRRLNFFLANHQGNDCKTAKTSKPVIRRSNDTRNASWHTKVLKNGHCVQQQKRVAAVHVISRPNFSKLTEKRQYYDKLSYVFLTYAQNRCLWK